MNKQNKEYESGTTDLLKTSDVNKIYLYKKYKQKIVFQLSSLDVENILSLEKNNIHISPKEYIDLGG